MGRKTAGTLIRISKLEEENRKLKEEVKQLRNDLKTNHMEQKKNKETLEDLIKQLSLPEVLERGEKLNKQFNNFTVEELYRPFNI